MRPHYLDVIGLVVKRLLMAAAALVVGWVLGASLMAGMAGGFWWLAKRQHKR